MRPRPTPSGRFLLGAKPMGASILRWVTIILHLIWNHPVTPAQACPELFEARPVEGAGMRASDRPVDGGIRPRGPTSFTVIPRTRESSRNPPSARGVRRPAATPLPLRHPGGSQDLIVPEG